MQKLIMRFFFFPYLTRLTRICEADAFLWAGCRQVSITVRLCCFPFEGGHLTKLNFKGVITVLLDSEVHTMILFFFLTKLKKNLYPSDLIVVCFSGQFYLQNMF